MEDGIKACIICFRTNSQIHLLELFDCHEDKIAYSEKLKCFTDGELADNKYTLICVDCVIELNQAFEFRKKVISSQEFWKTQFEKYINSAEVTDNNELEYSNQNYADTDFPLENDKDSIIQDVLDANVQIAGDHSLQFEDSQLIDDFKDTKDGLNMDMDELDENYSCNKCSEKFRKLAELINHVCGYLECDSEPLIMKSINVPEEEKKKCKIKEKIYRCDICEVNFDKRWQLKKHSFKIHNDEKKHICKYCGKAFKQSYHLQEHVTAHTGEKNFLCNVCGKNFQRISSQKRHMRTHEAPPGQKVKKTPFLCTICGKSFPYSNGAQRHMRIHTGEKKFECNMCSRKFNQSTHLQVHIRTHTGERPYMCNYCGDSFPLKASLQKHMKMHREDKDSVITANLEPNLSQTKKMRRQSELIIDDMYECEEIIPS